MKTKTKIKAALQKSGDTICGISLACIVTIHQKLHCQNEGNPKNNDLKSQKLSRPKLSRKTLKIKILFVSIREQILSDNNYVEI